MGYERWKKRQKTLSALRKQERLAIRKENLKTLSARAKFEEKRSKVIEEERRLKSQTRSGKTRTALIRGLGIMGRKAVSSGKGFAKKSAERRRNRPQPTYKRAERPQPRRANIQSPDILGGMLKGGSTDFIGFGTPTRKGKKKKKRSGNAFDFGF